MPLSNGGRAATPSLGSSSQHTGGRTLGVLVALSLVLFTVSVRGGEAGVLNVVRGCFQTVTMPVRYLGTLASMPFQGLGNVFVNLTSDQATLTELKDENARLAARNAQLEEAEQIATRLQSLLGLQSSYSLQSTAARIISGSTDSWSDTVTIDKGTSSGIAVGMPVAGSDGVIGQVVECGYATSVVRLVSDDFSSVPAMVQSSRAQGQLSGSATGQVTLTLVTTDQEVRVGDTVVTSGLGGVFPKGLPLGRVTSVESAPGSLYLDIIVEQYSKTENYEEVLVITSLTEGQQASSTDIAAADAQEKGAATPGSSSTSSDGSSSTSSSTDVATSN